MLKGIYTPIVTPFKENGDIDYESMDFNLEKWIQTDLDGLVVLGSNGEFAYLSQEEKLELATHVIMKVDKRKKIIVGTGCESTRETIKFSNQAAQAGADAVLVLPPHYYKKSMNDEVFFAYFTEVANNIDVPLMIYNMPGNTGVNLTSSVIARLSKNKNIIGIKDTSGDIIQIGEMLRDVDKDFVVFAGSAGYLLPALCLGAKGATLALANILPEDCCRLVQLYHENKLAEARELQLKMIEINKLVTGVYGIPGLKVGLDQKGYKGGLPRKPLLPLEQSKKEVLLKTLEEYDQQSSWVQEAFQTSSDH
ncbi:MAG: Putative 4-hydroxy-2-oxoglutarate aldolase,mitochondrial [Clostridiales bacterium 38_11]|nr:MAG: Putative 4-hydroxy-2-oxoglutarate aldolase,mitochondrial [Clostridiales bacterium 38_11]